MTTPVAFGNAAGVDFTRTSVREDKKKEGKWKRLESYTQIQDPRNKDINEKSMPVTPNLCVCPFDIFQIIEHRCRIRHPMMVYMYTTLFASSEHAALVLRGYPR